MDKQARSYYDTKLDAFSDKAERVFERVVPDISKIKKVHLVGICGTAMGSLGGLLAAAGYKVSGSDEACYPPMSDLIKELGLEFKEGYKAEHVTGADLVVVGNASKPSNPEAAYAKEQGLPMLSLPEAIRLFFIGGINPKKSLVVAGTHGKTTTTGMLAHVFQHAGTDPSYMVGGVMQNYAQSFRLGKGSHFIIEGDEYDTAYFDKSPKFLHYVPTCAIITSLEFDHIDIYKNMEEYTQAFTFLAEELPPDGALFLCGDDPAVRALASAAECPVYFYGIGERNDITARNITIHAEGQEFDLVMNGEAMGVMELPLSGKHNLQNALAVCGLALQQGISIEDLKAGLRTFRGMKRRQEIIGDVGGVVVIDDFAHHPTAVRETIKAIREKYPDRRLITAFEPRSNTSRRKVFEAEYGRAFDEADVVCLSIPPFRHNDKKEDFIDADHVVALINQKSMDGSIKAGHFPNADELLSKLVSRLLSGDVVLVMSNGSFDGLNQKLLAALQK